MGLVLKHVVVTRAGTRHYRRRFPKAVSGVIGKGEFKRYLGETDREALRNYPKVNAEFERTVADARRRMTGVGANATALEIHREAERRARELAQSRVYVGGEALDGSDPEAADIMRDDYFASFPTDPETGEPVGVPEVEGRAYVLLSSGGKVSRPSPTIDDAQRLYRLERIGGDINERAKSNQLSLVMRHIAAAGLELARPLDKLTREDARNVRDYLLRDIGNSPTSARRYINVIRAVINFGLAEFDLRDAQNPFLDLPIRGGEATVNDREPFPDEALPDVRQRIENHAGGSLWQIWRLVENTGCRLGEVTGLMVSDLHLDADIPHINLVAHPHRRLKNAGSARKVPLIGDALEAAREAKDAAGDGALLFPRYGRLRGADAASAILMKHVRSVTDERKVVVHSLRHRIEDKLTDAGVSEFDRNLVLGHSHGGMSERYGGAEARLRVAQRALRAALDGATVEQADT